MFRRAFLGLCAALLTAISASGTATAQTSAADELYDLLGFPELLEIMVEEGESYGDQVRDDLFPGRGGAVWETAVARAYDFERMDGIVRRAFADVLEDMDIAPIAEFFASEQGRRIIDLELSARRAMLGDGVEEAALEAFGELAENDPGRVDLIRAFVEANDLVESNVVGTMNSNFAFYKGLNAGGAFPEEMTDGEIVTDIWRQEGAIRESTADWVYSYLSLAYGPLSDEELAAYVAFSETQAGQDVTRAIFEAFDELFVSLSRDLGFAAAQFVGGQEL